VTARSMMSLCDTGSGDDANTCPVQRGSLAGSLLIGQRVIPGQFSVKEAAEHGGYGAEKQSDEQFVQKGIAKRPATSLSGAVQRSGDAGDCREDRECGEDPTGGRHNLSVGMEPPGTPPNGLRSSCGLRRPQTRQTRSLPSGRRGPTASSAG
jgi:hypothetical protein